MSSSPPKEFLSTRQSLTEHLAAALGIVRYRRMRTLIHVLERHAKEQQPEPPAAG